MCMQVGVGGGRWLQVGADEHGQRQVRAGGIDRETAAVTLSDLVGRALKRNWTLMGGEQGK